MTAVSVFTQGDSGEPSFPSVSSTNMKKQATSLTPCVTVEIRNHPGAVLLSKQSSLWVTLLPLVRHTLVFFIEIKCLPAEQVKEVRGPLVLPVLLLMLALRMSPLEMCCSPKLLVMRADTVPFPDPGGPIMIARNTLRRAISGWFFWGSR